MITKTMNRSEKADSEKKNWIIATKIEERLVFFSLGEGRRCRKRKRKRRRWGDRRQLHPSPTTIRSISLWIFVRGCYFYPPSSLFDRRD